MPVAKDVATLLPIEKPVSPFWSRPLGVDLLDLELPKAHGGTMSTIESTRSSSPSNTASTAPSVVFRTQPSDPSDLARSRVSARKKTPGPSR